MSNQESSATPDKLDLALKAVSESPSITDEQLAKVLGLIRPASARFWRIKALSLLEKEAKPKV